MLTKPSPTRNACILCNRIVLYELRLFESTRVAKDIAAHAKHALAFLRSLLPPLAGRQLCNQV
ncbi:hypothetical protein [Variovorax sp. E3]|uniref:hypothetical protein n=1 Tax=Variovorax sp. E3 TaxID=1914993 RepID=UPI0018DDA2E5|nr:hypothetical protein [Variovorax sp. E3]